MVGIKHQPYSYLPLPLAVAAVAAAAVVARLRIVTRQSQCFSPQGLQVYLCKPLLAAGVVGPLAVFRVSQWGFGRMTPMSMAAMIFFFNH
jgi:hypothetical protein